MTGRRNAWMDIVRVAYLVKVVLYRSTFIGPRVCTQRIRGR